MLIGIVGKANVGKSTFFKAATLAEVEIANYPFTTLQPNEGYGFVKVTCPEKDFQVKCQPRFGYCYQGKRFVPVKLIDVAGLVPGAHLGKGRGNQFLDNLRQADVLIQVIDLSGSTNEKGEFLAPGAYDPAEDIKFLEIELNMWYFGLLKKGWEKFSRTVVQEKRKISSALGKQLSGLKISPGVIEKSLQELNLDQKKPSLWEEEELKKLAQTLREKSKPLIIAANKLDLPPAEENFFRLKKQFPHHLLIPCSAEVELALKEAAKLNLISYLPGDEDFEILKPEKLTSSQEKGLFFIKTFLKKFKTTGLQQVLDKAVFDVLKYVPVFPVENSHLTDKNNQVLPDCFLLPPGSTALDLAYHLHTDLGKTFLKALDMRTKKIVGKAYLLKENDVLEIITQKKPSGRSLK